MHYETCSYTGKRMIATEAQAKEFLRKPKTPVTKDGKRVKRRIKKRKEKRAFYCDDCKHWHLTSKKHYKNKKKNSEEQ